MSTIDVQRWSDISDVLGPAEKRYFGSTFRTTHQRADLLVEESSPGGYDIAGDTQISYVDGGWAGGEASTARTPHFSSLDAVVLSAKVALELEAHTRVKGLIDDSQRLCLRNLHLRAGSEPDESTESVPVHGTAEARGGTSCPVEASAALQVGQMKVSLVMGSVARTEHTAEVLTGDVALGNMPELRLTDVEMNSSSRTAECHISYPATEMWCDAFAYVATLVTIGQLIQSSLYDLDEISREDSGNLWMRSFGGELHPTEDSTNARRARIALSKHKHLDMRGRRWSASQWQCRTLGVLSDASVAYDITGSGRPAA